MDNSFKKISLLLILLTLVSVLFFPKLSLAQEEVILNQAWGDCVNSVAQVNLVWSSTILGDPVFHILRDDGTEYVDIGNTTDLFYIDFTVLSDKGYSYKIKAIRNGDEFFSNEESISALYCSPTLSDPGASCQSDGPHLLLDWQPVSGDLLTYEVYRNYSLLTSTGLTSIDDGPNIIGTETYYYYVKAIWQDGASSTSGVKDEIALACPPTLNVGEFCESAAEPGGPQVNLSWNELLGVLEYQIYRNVRGEGWNTLGDSLTGISYTDKLVESLPSTYNQEGVVSYFIKAIWGTAEKDSLEKQISIPWCPPFLMVESNCKEFSMRLSWTATRGAIHYNIYRDGEFLCQTGGVLCPNESDAVDYLNLVVCPGEICTLAYKVEAIVPGEDSISSNEATKDIDCATIIPPSPAPHLDEPEARCQGDPLLDSVISNSWSESNNVFHYSLHRLETISGNEVIPYEGYVRAFVDMGVESGYEYTYWVVAIGEGETSTTSNNTVTIVAVGCQSPSTPTTNLTTGCGATAPFVNVSWTGTTNTYSYRIYRGLSEGDLSFKAELDENSRNWTDSNVSTSATYYYKVTAVGPSGVPSTDSLVVPILTPSCLPTTPALYSIAPDCSGTIPIINLTWSTDEANTDYYEIYRKDYSEVIPIDTTPDRFTKTWTDNSVLPETAYEYKVVAVGNWGQRTTEGYKPSVTSYDCQAPGSFILSDPPDDIYCKGYSPWTDPYPWVDLSWSDSDYALSYDLNRNLYDNGSIIETVTLSGVASPFIDRGFGKTLSFDGYNDRVSVGSSDSLKSTNQISIEAWIYPIYSSSYNARYGAIMGYINGYYRNRIYIDNYTTSRPRLRSYFYGGSGLTSLLGPKLTYDNWNHIVYVYDGTKQSLYLNGEEKASSSRSGSFRTGDYSTRIGDGYYSYNQFKGEIDEVRIYGRALTPTEISEHYQGAYSDESELRGLWHFDESSGGGVSDSSNYGNNGSISGASWAKHGPQCENKYSWQAIANNMGGSTFSNITNSLTMPMCSPGKPGLVLSPFCQGEKSSVEISWSFSINATGYDTYRDGSLVASTSVIGPDPSNRIFIDDNNGLGLATGTVYTYWVEASGITAVESDHLEVTTLDCTLPGPAEGLQVSFGCGDYDPSCPGSYPRVQLEWQETLNANYYEIWRMVGAGSYFSLATTTATSHTDAYPSVEVNTDYSYYIEAHSSGGSVSSDPASITTGFCLPCQASVSFYTDCSYGGSPSPINEVSWTDGTDFNTVGYKIYRNTIDDFPSATEIVTITRAMSEFSSKYYEDNDPLLADNTTYYYWVEVLGYIGDTNLSDSGSITTHGCSAVPNAPADLDITTDCCQGIPCSTSTWTPSPQYAYSYNVYRDNLDAGITETYSARTSPFLDQGSFALEIENNKTEYVNVPKSGSLDFSNDRFSIEAWIYPLSGGDTYSTFLGCFNGYSSNRIYIYYWNRILRAYFRWSKGGSNTFYGPSINWSQWNHVVYTYDGHYQRWYLNGALTHSGLWEDDSLVSSVSSLRIGRGSWSSYEFKGTIDEVRVYGRALKPEEISDHYNEIYNNEFELRGAWHFDEGIGTIAYDSSGNGNDGTFVNEPEWIKPLDHPAYVWPLSEGESYKYYVKAFGIGTESDSSNEVSLTAPVCGPVVEDFSVTPQCSGGDSQIRLDWDTTNTLYCDVLKRREGDPGPFVPIAQIFDPENSYIDRGGGIASGQTYEYLLQAFGEGGENIFWPWVESAEALVCAESPQAPVITVSTGCYGYNPRMLIQWSEDPSGYTLSYNVWKKNEDCSGSQEFATIVVGLSPDTVQYFDLDVIEEETYCYKVEARGSGEDNFAFSEPVASTSLACSTAWPPPPELEINFIHLEVGNCAVSLGWTDVGLDPGLDDNFYEILRSLDGTSYSSLATTTGDVFNYLDQPVGENTDYYYVVQAHNKNGGTYSNSVLAEVKIAPPGGFTLTGEWIGGTNKVRLTWTEAETGAGGSVSYDVLRDDTDSFDTPTLICGGISALQYFDDSPTFLEPFYKVVATNSGGSTDSNVIDMYNFPFPTWIEVTPQ